MNTRIETDLMMDDMLSRILEDVRNRYPTALSEPEENPPPAPPLRAEDAVDAIGWDGADEFKLADSFPRTLARMLREKGLTGPKVYNKIGMDRKEFSKIASIAETKTPIKGEVLALAVGMGLSPAEARELMASAGFAFSLSSKVDNIIMYFLQNGEKDIVKIDAALWKQANTSVNTILQRRKGSARSAR